MYIYKIKDRFRRRARRRRLRLTNLYYGRQAGIENGYSGGVFCIQ